MKTKIELKRTNGDVIFSHECENNSVAKTIEALRRTSFEEFDLHCADLRHADLSDANLSGANLWHADLSCADLRCADLSCADLSGAYLRYADLRFQFLLVRLKDLAGYRDWIRYIHFNSFWYD